MISDGRNYWTDQHLAGRRARRGHRPHRAGAQLARRRPARHLRPAVCGGPSVAATDPARTGGDAGVRRTGPRGRGPDGRASARRKLVAPPSTDVSFSVGRGEIVGLVGESGCGKTMTALAVMRLLPPAAHVAAGRVLLDGEDLLALSTGEMRRRRGTDVSMVFQEPMTALDPSFTIGSQLVEAIRAHDVGSQRRRRARGRSRCSSASASRTRRRAARRLPAPVLGRHAPARDDRHGARCSSRSC